MCSDNFIIDEWHVCFKEVPRKHWVQKFLKRGFWHCYAYKQSPGGQFLIVVDSARSHLDIDLLPNTVDNLNILNNCNKLVTVVVRYDLAKDRGHFCRFNCVEVVKALIGVRSFLTMTPYQLYKRLIK